ncbi:MAG: glycine--tRNA ligase subunit beta [Alphaproteobacteria bacterium]|nr:glycine--tRNA ligase subunit beta [Alphaproteobacteria bacterium]
MPEFLLEILSEEIPARMQARAAEDLQRLVTGGLKDAKLEYETARVYVTPRRLALVVEGLPEKQPDMRDERRGPRVDAPDKAIQGFLSSAGLDSVEQCEQRTMDKGTFLFVVIEKAGEPTATLLNGIVNAALRALPWPKAMRWADNRYMRWVRPLHSILCVFDGVVVDGGYGFADEGGHETIPYTDRTVGHRFLAPEPFRVDDFADYKAKLEKAYVLLDPVDRRARIEAGLAGQAKAEKLRIKDDPGLLAEVAGLVEWPVVLLGSIDPDFMELPREVLTSSMRAHQKYFALETPDGAFAPRFGLVANMETPDGGVQVVAGNERVLRARLADAKFFWDQDRKRSLASRAPALREIVFHAKLGTVEERVDRVQALATALTDHVPGADKDRVRSAARLCKADLVTGMVGEFPDLQGVMGRYYAEHDGEHAEVAQAIAEHYSPLGPNDDCPTAPVSVALALADKIDTLVGFWAIDEKPTGSRDPFALRRAALGTIRLIVENDLRFGLLPVFRAAFDVYAESLPGIAALRQGPNNAAATQAIWNDLLEFFADRLKVHLRETGVRHDLITAVFSLGGEDDLVRILARVKALEDFLGTDDGANLLVAFKRAANIVRIEEKKDKTKYNGGADSNVFAEAEESALYTALTDAASAAGAAVAEEDFTGAMAAMAALRKPVDAFFDRVTVNADDATLRTNRLRLLSAIDNTLREVADFSRIEG